MAKIHIGVSGWQYAGWRGDFYPQKLPARRHLEYASACFGAIEVNGTFYSLKSPQAFASWRETAVPGTLFALKAPRYVTHMLRLRNAENAVANFFANGMLRLEDGIGPILWQFPPHMKWEPEVFERFCALLPKDTVEAAKVGKRHDDRVAGKTSLQVDRARELRHVFEIRDRSMLQDDALDLLRSHGYGLVIADTAQRHPYAEDITSTFVYIRLHGAEELYASGYDDASLRHWADRISMWHRGGQPSDAVTIGKRSPPRCKSRDVYVFFDNDAKVHAPFDALTLARMLGQGRDVHDLRDRDGERLPVPPRLLRVPPSLHEEHAAR